MGRTRTKIILGLLAFFGLHTAATAAPELYAATLPDSRSVTINEPATYFATIVNSGDTDATLCGISLAGSNVAPVELHFQTTDTNNNLIGFRDNGATVPAGGSQTFLVELTPTSAYSGTVPLAYWCAASSAQGQPGVNDVVLVADATNPPDMLSIIATPSNDGVLRVNSAGGVEAAGVAVVNNGGGGDTAVTLTPVMRNFDDLASLSICETDNTGACTSAIGASVDTTIGVTPKTFSIFADAPDQGGIALYPGYTRIGMDVTEAASTDKPLARAQPMAGAGTLRGSTSVAFTAPAPDVANGIPTGIYSFQIRDEVNDPTGSYIGNGEMVVAPDGTTMGWWERLDDGAPYEQLFTVTGDFFPDYASGPLFGGTMEFYPTPEGQGNSFTASLTYSYSMNSSFIGTYSYQPQEDKWEFQVTAANRPQFFHTSTQLAMLGAIRVLATYQAITLGLISGNYDAFSASGSYMGILTVDPLGSLSGTLLLPGTAEACLVSGGMSPLEAIGMMTLVDFQLAQCGLPPPTLALAYVSPESYQSLQRIRLLVAFQTFGMILILNSAG